jgi:hypothetical protein
MAIYAILYLRHNYCLYSIVASLGWQGGEKSLTRDERWPSACARRRTPHGTPASGAHPDFGARGARRHGYALGRGWRPGLVR